MKRRVLWITKCHVKQALKKASRNSYARSGTKSRIQYGVPSIFFAFYVMDRGYLDYARLNDISLAAGFFVTRSKSNLRCRRIYSHQVDRSTGLRYDQTIMLTEFYSLRDYPDKLRRIKYYDTETNKTVIFLTNNFSLPALTIAQLYRCRWQVELIFKWIKQNLRIKNFYGTLQNAVKTQIWIAISVYVLVAILKKRLNVSRSLYTILQILSVTVFERIPLLQPLTDTTMVEEILDSQNQRNGEYHEKK